MSIEIAILLSIITLIIIIYIVMYDKVKLYDTKIVQYRVEEKDVEYDNRFFIHAVYKNGDSQLVNNEPIKESEIESFILNQIKGK